ATISAGEGPMVWHDFLAARYRLDVAHDARALVIAETITTSLKRAPRTMARSYRRATATGLTDLLVKFDCQRIPASLLDYSRFREAYKRAPADDIISGLDSETDGVRFPQVVNVATCAS